MSYLLDFIKTFEDKEWALFRNLDLTGKEELVRDVYARNGGTKKSMSSRFLLLWVLRNPILTKSIQ